LFSCDTIIEDLARLAYKHFPSLTQRRFSRYLNQVPCIANRMDFNMNQNVNANNPLANAFTIIPGLGQLIAPHMTTGGLTNLLRTCSAVNRALGQPSLHSYAGTWLHGIQCTEVPTMWDRSLPPGQCDRTFQVKLCDGRCNITPVFGATPTCSNCQRLQNQAWADEENAWIESWQEYFCANCEDVEMLKLQLSNDGCRCHRRLRGTWMEFMCREWKRGQVRLDGIRIANYERTRLKNIKRTRKFRRNGRMAERTLKPSRPLCPCGNPSRRAEYKRRTNPAEVRVQYCLTCGKVQRLAID